MANLNPIKFIASVITESKSVIWPTRQLIITHTLAVIASVGVFVLIFAGVDFVFQKLLLLSLGQ
jgi:preprotein translocase SecE subunit